MKPSQILCIVSLFFSLACNANQSYHAIFQNQLLLVNADGSGLLNHQTAVKVVCGTSKTKPDSAYLGDFTRIQYPDDTSSKPKTTICKVFAAP